VLRGGSWYSEHRTARVASRSFVGPALLDVDVGLRVVRTLASRSGA
jgi:formylglycine-generating enzyme required for sulfatase activity